MLRVDGLSVGYVAPLLRPVDAAGLRRTVALAEAAGIDHLGVCDHVSFHVGAGFDGLLTAGMLLALSDQLEVNTGVYLLPLRHPVLVARQLADLALLAPGRLTFGVGLAGEDPEEVAVCGVDPHTRGRRMDACMEIVRDLLAGKPVDHESEFFLLEGAQIAPAPIEPIPMPVGGRSEAALRRAGRLGDGWIGVFVSAARFADAVGHVTAAAAAAERGAVDLRHGLVAWCGVGHDADEARSYVAPAMEEFYRLPYASFERYAPAGTPAQVADFLLPYVEAGCSTFNLLVNGASPEAEVEAVAEVRARLLAATA